MKLVKRRRDKKQIKDQRKPRPRHRFPVIDECQLHAETQTSLMRHSIGTPSHACHVQKSCESRACLFSVLSERVMRTAGRECRAEESCDTLLSTRLARRTAKNHVVCPCFAPRPPARDAIQVPVGGAKVNSHRNEFFSYHGVPPNPLAN